MLVSATIASGTIAFLLIVAIAVEMASPLTRHTLRERAFGAMLVITLPGLLIMLSYPLSNLWKALEIPPAINLGNPHQLVSGLTFLLAFDFLRYWEHRFEHRFWWPVHSVHHSPRELHAANAFAHPFQFLPEFMLVTIPLSLIRTGASPTTVLIVSLIVSMQNLLIHSPLRVHFGRARMLFVDSRFHRIHHSLRAEHRDKNFSIVFPVWDRLFGTYFPARDNDWPAVGVEGIAPVRTIREYLAFPFRRNPVVSETGVSEQPEPARSSLFNK